MLQNQIEGVLDMTFSTESDELGETKTFDLIPNGRKVAVTDDNKVLYVHLLSDFMLTRAIKKQIESFLQGFHELVPKHIVQIFNEKELELMLCGLPDIDLSDLKANIEYRGWAPDSQVIQWFWQILSTFDQEEKALLVLFVTGTSKVPLDGFKALQGSNGVNKFTIQKASGVDRLPVAHTCFNQLDLGEYSSMEVMKEKLMFAIKEGSQGFGFR